MMMNQGDSEEDLQVAGVTMTELTSIIAFLKVQGTNEEITGCSMGSRYSYNG